MDCLRNQVIKRSRFCYHHNRDQRNHNGISMDELKMQWQALRIGSDTHDTQHLADHSSDVKKELKKLGFNKYCTYEKMIPIYHEL